MLKDSAGEEKATEQEMKQIVENYQNLCKENKLQQEKQKGYVERNNKLEITEDRLKI